MCAGTPLRAGTSCAEIPDAANTQIVEPNTAFVIKRYLFIVVPFETRYARCFQAILQSHGIDNPSGSIPDHTTAVQSLRCSESGKGGEMRWPILTVQPDAVGFCSGVLPCFNASDAAARSIR